LVKGPLPVIYAHAVSLRNTSKPRLTFTSHPVSGDATVWHLGGNLAEWGVGKSSGELIARAQSELTELLPWVNLDQTEWASFEISRAEAAQVSNFRPDHPFVESAENCIVCWPTKLTLVPMLGESVLAALAMQPRETPAPVPDFPTPGYAKTPWELAFD